MRLPAALTAAAGLPARAARLPARAARLPAGAAGVPARVGRLPATAAALPRAVARTVGDALPATTARRPVRSHAPGRTSIALRGAHEPDGATFAQAVREALSLLDGVTRAEVNGVLGHVLVEHDEEVPAEALLAVIEEIERSHGARQRPFAPAVHPTDRRPAAREMLLTGTDLAASGMAVVGRLLRTVPTPPGLPAVLALVDATPRLRDGIERYAGHAATAALFDLGTAAAHAMSQQPVGLALNAVHRVVQTAELRSRQEAWRRREPELHAAGAFATDPVLTDERPVPLPDGPVERVCWSAPLALATGAATYLLTRDPGRAQGFLAAGVPKAARVGRETLAARLGRAAAEQGVVVIDPAALRRLDRVDQVVVDVSAVRTGRQTIEEVIPLAEPPAGPPDGTSPERTSPERTHPEGTPSAEKVYERAYALVDSHSPGSARQDGDWRIGPLRGSAVPADAVRAAREHAERLRGATVLVLSHRDVPVALVSVVPEADPLAEALICAAREVGPVLLSGAATGPGRALARRLPVDGTLPGGNRLLESVRGLQRDGRVVALVSAHHGPALAAADVGIGLLGPGRRPPWGAHALGGPELTGVRLLLTGAVAARENSRRCARVAALGGAAGALLAAAGPSATAAQRAQLAVDCAVASALALGIWSGLALTRLPAPVPVNRSPWHAWPVRAVLRHLDSSPLGIPADESDRRRAATADGEPPEPGLGRLTLEELNNPLTPALAAGAGISAVVGSVTDAALIGTVLATNALLAGAQRVGAEQALRRLVDLSTVKVRLRRPRTAEATEPGTAVDERTTDSPTTDDHAVDGHAVDGHAVDGHAVEEVVAADALAPGDVVRFGAGDSIPVDCRLISADNLEVDESSLTGESQPVTKSARPSMARMVADRRSMLYEGTVVAAGEAVAVVVATGAGTELGRTTRLAGERPAEGGVEKRLRQLTRAALPASVAAGGLLLGSDLMRGRPLAQALGSAVSLAVAAVPEGLPFVATAAELATAGRLSRRRALVRNPATVEALGRVDVLCFDKTGTLTEGRLRLRQVSDGFTSAPVDRAPDHLLDVVATALRAGPELNGKRPPHPTDRAIIRAAEHLGAAAIKRMDGWKRIDELPFEPARGYHAVLGRTTEGHLRLSVKGAPEIVLDRCGSLWRDGRARGFDPESREQVKREVDRLARRGYRVLAVAERASSGRRGLTEQRIGRLCFHGLLGIADPVRPAAAEAVSRLRAAGVDILMITGDHPSTAEAIAAELKVPDGRIVTGADVDALDDDQLARGLDGATVFARVSPAQKARVVRALRSLGRVVAVTGDGANDAPAIRLADVGIALGERATPAARETADVVVTDDRIETITDAIADCRAMWRSTRDALAVLLGGNLGEIGFTVGVGLLRGGSPLGVRQLLLVNLLTDVLPAVALAVRPPPGVSRERLLAEGPDRSLGQALTRHIAVRAGTTAGAATVAWLLGRASGTAGQAATTGLVALVGTQLLQTVAAGGTDPLVLAAGLASFGLLATIVQVPGLSHFFGCRPLLPHGWVIALGSAAAFTVPAVLLTGPLSRAR